MFCLLRVCLPWLLWHCNTQPCEWACVYVSKATVPPVSAVTSRILIAYCHLTHGEFLCRQLSSGAMTAGEGERGSAMCCRLSCGTTNQKPHADVLLPPAFMLIHHSKVTSHCSWWSRIVDQHLIAIVSECSHQSPSHTEGQFCIHFICKWLSDSICTSHQT